jgi:NTE family protein
LPGPSCGSLAHKGARCLARIPLHSASDMAEELHIGMALSSGGAAGLAHVGVLQELLAAGIPVDSVAGASAGAIVGAAYAADHLAELRDALTALTRRGVMALFDPIWPRTGLLAGRRAMDLIRPHVGELIEELPRPYAAVATDLHSGDEVVLTRGEVIDAVRASVAIPGVFPPQPLHGRWLVDGALVNPIPISVARQLGAQFVIAVSVIATPHPAISTGPFAARVRQPSGPQRTRFRTGPQLQAAPNEPLALASPDGVSNLRTVLSKASALIQANTAVHRLRDEPPDYLIAPAVADIGLFDFHRAAEAIEAGRVATVAVLPELLAAIDRAGAATAPASSWLRWSWDRGRQWFSCAPAERAAA